MHELKSTKGFLVAVIALAVCAIALLVFFRSRREEQPARQLTAEEQTVADGAKRFGLDSEGSVTGLNLLKKAEATGDLSDADWIKTKELLKHPQPSVAATALSVMTHLRNSAKREEAIAIAHDVYKNQTGHMHRTALICLYHLQAPEWRADVEAARKSSDPDDRQVAEGILRRDAGLGKESSPATKE